MFLPYFTFSRPHFEGFLFVGGIMKDIDGFMRFLESRSNYDIYRFEQDISDRVMTSVDRFYRLRREWEEMEED